MRAFLPSIVAAQEAAGGAYGMAALDCDPAAHEKLDAALRDAARSELEQLAASIPGDVPVETRVLARTPAARSRPPREISTPSAARAATALSGASSWAGCRGTC